MARAKKLEKDYQELKERTQLAGAKYRAIMSNWRNGIVGVDQPGLLDQE